jgi:pimeloyl-ACP methyl ester carboxylesterase
MRPQTQYAKSGDVHVAYQVSGEGVIEVVIVHGLISHLDLYRDWPSCARFLERLGSFARVIQFDERGVGLSDRVSALPCSTRAGTTPSRRHARRLKRR